MFRIIVTVLIIQVGIILAVLHWASGRAFVSFNNVHVDESKQISTQKYVQTVGESGTLMFGGREEPLRSYHQKLKIPKWSGRLAFPSGEIAAAPATRAYRFGISVTTHDKDGFRATYIHFRIWLLDFLALAAGCFLWADKWFNPLTKCLRRSKKKNCEQGVAPQSATRSESDSERGDKPQPESEARSR